MASQALESARRQERIGSAVWGLTLMVMGALFMLDSLGTIDMGARSQHSASRAVDGDPQDALVLHLQRPPVDHGRSRLEAGDHAHQAQLGGGLRHRVPDRGLGRRLVLDDRRGRCERARRHRGAQPLRQRTLRAPGRDEARDAVGLLALGAGGLRPGQEPDSQGKSATASSREGTSYWLIFWPVLLIAAGLPALIAPKDPGNQVLGLILASTGLVLQARNLGLLPWSFNETLAVLLILTGTVLVLRRCAGRAVARRRSLRARPRQGKSNTRSRHLAHSRLTSLERATGLWPEP